MRMDARMFGSAPRASSTAMKRHDRGVGVDVTVFCVQLQNAALVGGPPAVGPDHGLHRRTGGALADLESAPEQKLGAGHAQGIRGPVECTVRRRGCAEHLM